MKFPPTAITRSLLSHSRVNKKHQCCNLAIGYDSLKSFTMTDASEVEAKVKRKPKCSGCSSFFDEHQWETPGTGEESTTWMIQDYS